MPLKQCKAESPLAQRGFLLSFLKVFPTNLVSIFKQIYDEDFMKGGCLSLSQKQSSHDYKRKAA